MFLVFCWLYFQNANNEYQTLQNIVYKTKYETQEKYRKNIDWNRNAKRNRNKNRNKKKKKTLKLQNVNANKMKTCSTRLRLWPKLMWSSTTTGSFVRTVYTWTDWARRIDYFTLSFRILIASRWSRTWCTTENYWPIENNRIVWLNQWFADYYYLSNYIIIYSLVLHSIYSMGNGLYVRLSIC